MATHTQSLPEVISVLVFAELYDEARRRARSLGRASPTPRLAPLLRDRRHRRLPARLPSRRRQRRHRLGPPRPLRRRRHLAHAIATGTLVLALIERGDLEVAQAELDQSGLTAQLLPTWPCNGRAIAAAAYPWPSEITPQRGRT